MNKLVCSTNWIALTLLLGIPASAEIDVVVTASTSGHGYLSSYTADVTYHSSVVVTNNLPAYYNAIVNWYIEYASDDCFFTNEVLNRSFCCAGSGNSAAGNIYDTGVACWVAAHCEAYAYVGGADDFDSSGCVEPCIEPGDGGGNSPIVLSMNNQRIELTDLAGGVSFDLNSDGSPEAISWTSREADDDAFLVLDRNGNNVIDDGSELFGDTSPQPPGDVLNGFRALAVFDELAHGGNSDGYISAEDSVFASLRLWFDSSHDGISQGTELRTLASQGIERIDLRYRETSRRDRYGNGFKFKGKAMRNNGRNVPLWDVYFLTE